MGYFFGDEARKEISDLLTYEDVLDYLAIPTKRKGRYIQFLCPSHDDTHFGSAMVDTAKGNCRCYACNKSFSKFDLVAESEHISFYDAEVKLAELAGVLENYSSKKAPAKTATLKKLTHSEAEILGIDTFPAMNCVAWEAIKPCNEDGYWEYDNNSDCYTKLEKSDFSLNSLYKEDKVAYVSLILNKVHEKYLHLTEVMEDIYEVQREHPGDKSLLNFGNILINALNEQRKEVYKIGLCYGYDKVLTKAKKTDKDKISQIA